jgi:hypothetical protein
MTAGHAQPIDRDPGIPDLTGNPPSSHKKTMKLSEAEDVDLEQVLFFHKSI